ncbi:MAG: MgtC/SapB family protein [Candidatus Competibacterales bacterium]|nr:MgtC/SapB family protein [Candidatus Competibacterales bacterium]
MDDLDTIKALATALGLGLLIGLQRERVDKSLAGIRTFPLITLFGALCGLLADAYGTWLVAAGLLALVLLIAIENLRRLPRNPDNQPSLTTEAALLVMFVVGAWLAQERPGLALAVTGTVVVLLHAKQPMHGFVHRLGEHDLTALIQFVVISLIILPLLPNRAYGPFQVLNPFEIWLMVVLIVGLNFAGFVAYRLFSTRSGTLVAGLLGGLVSSTATTFSYSRQARTGGLSSALAGLVIIIASGVVFARVLAEIAVVAASHLPVMAPPMIVLLLINLAVIAAALWLVSGHAAGQSGRPSNPAELKPALAFGALYAAVLFAVAAVKDLFGEGALYLLAIISGLTDVDAITLSTARLVDSGRLEAETGWRLIVTAALANLAFKLGVTGLLGGLELLRRTLLLAAFTFAAGLLLILLWPDTMIRNLHGF